MVKPCKICILEPEERLLVEKKILGGEPLRQISEELKTKDIDVSYGAVHRHRNHHMNYSRQLCEEELLDLFSFQRLFMPDSSPKIKVFFGGKEEWRRKFHDDVRNRAKRVQKSLKEDLVRHGAPPDFKVPLSKAYQLIIMIGIEEIKEVSLSDFSRVLGKLKYKYSQR